MLELEKAFVWLQWALRGLALRGGSRKDNSSTNSNSGTSPDLMLSPSISKGGPLFFHTLR